MARLAFALATALLLACAHQVVAGRALQTICPTPICPNGYTPMNVGTGGTACGYECYTPVKLNCPPSLGAPITCGGVTNKPCPSIACSYATSWAVSGPQGCAAAKSKIEAIAFSNSTYNLMLGTALPVIQSYCDNPNSMPLIAAVDQVVNAVSTAVAKTVIHWNTYVCSCCIGNSAAYTVVKADIQAVAKAQAQAIQELLGTVSQCYTNFLLAGAYAYVDAFAQSIELAIDSVYSPAVSVNGFNCGPNYFQPKVQTAVARALACTFANIFAGAIDSQTPGVTYACSDTLSISGYGGPPFQCPLDVACKCTPKAYQFDNFGFETGSFFGNPNWVSVNGGLAPSVTTSDGPVLPEEGSYFAIVPAGNPGTPSSISTKVTLPSCAKAVTAQYIYGCADPDAAKGFNDVATISITAKNVADPSIVKSGSITVDCLTVGFNKYSNNGAWAPLSVILNAPGTYQVTITATSENIKDTNFDSKLYVDDVSFA